MRRVQLKKAMGGWLGSLAKWDSFSTWTFAHPVTPQGAMFQARKHLRRLEALTHGWTPKADGPWNGWGYCESQVEAPRSPVQAFVGVEEGRVGGLVHLHALVAGVGGLEANCGAMVKLEDQLRQHRKGHSPLTCCMKHAWARGIARTLTYDRRLGAKHYVGKYVTKDLSEWDLIGFPTDPQNPRDLAAAAAPENAIAKKVLDGSRLVGVDTDRR